MVRSRCFAQVPAAKHCRDRILDHGVTEQGSDNGVRNLCFNPDPIVIATGAADRKLRVRITLHVLKYSERPADMGEELPCRGLGNTARNHVVGFLGARSISCIRTCRWLDAPAKACLFGDVSYAQN